MRLSGGSDAARQPSAAALLAVALAEFGEVVDFAHGAVCSLRDGGKGQGEDMIAQAASVGGIDDDGEMRLGLSTGRALKSIVLRVCVSKVRMPRSQKSTLEYPSLRM